jgi:hypothetical protein
MKTLLFLALCAPLTAQATFNMDDHSSDLALTAPVPPPAPQRK